MFFSICITLLRHVYFGLTSSACRLTFIHCIFVVLCFIPSRNVPKGDSHGKRASTFPYLHTPSLLVQSHHFYRHSFHAYNTSPYPSILQLDFLSLDAPVSLPYTFFSTNPSLFFLSLTKTAFFCCMLVLLSFLKYFTVDSVYITDLYARPVYNCTMF